MINSYLYIKESHDESIKNITVFVLPYSKKKSYVLIHFQINKEKRKFSSGIIKVKRNGNITYGLFRTTVSVNNVGTLNTAYDEYKMQACIVTGIHLTD